MTQIAASRAQLFLAMALVAIVLPLGCSQSRDSAKPALELIDLDGQPFNVTAPNGRITVAVFSRSDCPISNRFAPEIRRLHNQFHDQGVDFYLVYVDPLEEPEAIRKHLSEYNYPCGALRDPRHLLVRHCKAQTTPEAVVLDRKRNITYVGRINDLYTELGSARPEPTTNDLADAIEATLAEKPVAVPRVPAIGCPIADLAS